MEYLSYLCTYNSYKNYLTIKQLLADSLLANSDYLIPSFDVYSVINYLMVEKISLKDCSKLLNFNPFSIALLKMSTSSIYF